MKLKQILILLTVLSSFASYTQNRVKYELGKKYYDILGYSEAIPYFEEYLQKNSDDVHAIQLLSECYQSINDYENAEKWLKELASNSENNDNSVSLNLAKVLQSLSKYEDAATYYSKYLETSESRLATNQLIACKQINLFADQKDFLLEKVNFNKSGHDFGSFIFGDKFYFTTTEDITNNENKDVKKDMYLHENFMNINEVLYSKEEFTFSSAKPSTLGINTQYHEGPIWITEDGKTIFFTRNDYQEGSKGKDLSFDKNRITNLKIFKGDIYNDVVSNIVEFPFNSSEYSCGHPVFDEITNTLIFVSDMPGSIGGTDLWYSKFENNTFSTPMNFGETINTEGNEMFPFMSKDSMYFASNGIGGMGGLDIFVSVMNNRIPDKPKNMGAPINSSFDDFAFYKYNNSRVGFISSNRPGGVGKDDIYMIMDNHYDLEVMIVDATTNLPIENASVKGTCQGKEFINKLTDNSGKFVSIVKGTNTYNFVADAPFYYMNYDSITIMPSKTQDKFSLVIPLHPLVAKIVVKDAMHKTPISGALLTITHKCDKITDTTVTNTLGNYSFDVKKSCDLTIQATANSYFPKNLNYILTDGNDTIVIEIWMDRIHSEEIVLKNIYYDFDQSFIREDAEPDLLYLYTFLKSNPKVIVELSSHTDARGLDIYNLKLSQKRADAAKQWLVNRGIKSDRIIAIGYGENKPINSCGNDVKCTEEEHQMNRRTEFRVLNSGKIIESVINQNIKIDRCTDCEF
jgi:outer membrane protein OmpA-like peptidoglycan-associated protein